MLISVLICTFNRSAVLSGLLSQIKNQDTRRSFNFEIIIVDNNSVDDTKAMVEVFKSTTSIPTHYLYEVTQGKSYALNKGINHAHGDIIACIDDDVSIENDYLYQIFLAFNNHPHIGLLGGRILPRWMNGQYDGWLHEIFSAPAVEADGKPNWKKILFEGPLGILDYGPREFEIDCSKKGFDIRRFYGANMAFRAENIKSSGGFRTDKIISEDTEICDRLLGNGVIGLYSPNVKVWHKINRNRFSFGFYYNWYFWRGVHMEIREKVQRRFYHPLGIPLAFVRQTMGYLNQSIKEKCVINRARFRCLFLFNIGQMFHIASKNIY